MVQANQDRTVDSILKEAKRGLLESTGRSSKLTGAVILATGLSLLVSGFLTKDFFFEFDALVALLLGLMLLFRESDSARWREIGAKSVVSSYSALGDLFPGFSALKVTYSPGPAGGRPRAVIEVAEKLGQGPMSPGQGAAPVELTPPGDGIFTLIGEQGIDVQLLSPEAVIELLPRVLVDQFGLAKEVDFESAPGRVTMRARRPAFGQVYKLKNRGLVETLGCPMASAVAMLLARVLQSELQLSCSFQEDLRVLSAEFHQISPPRPSHN